MSRSRAVLLLSATLLAAATMAGASGAGAKGDSYLVGATIGGADASTARQIEVPATENEFPTADELDAPADQQPAIRADRRCTGSPACIAAIAPAPHAPAAGELPYRVVLHYDFGEYGGKRDWAGSFDGGDVLFFPGPMIVGPGLWAAGWYRASPQFAEQLRRAMGIPIRPPGAGDGGLLGRKTGG